MSLATSPSPRTTCKQCLRPQKACLCHCVYRAPSDVQLLVLQHPDEVGHAKNTARLLHLCVAGSRWEVGEHFDPQWLQHGLHAPWTCPDSGSHPACETLPIHTVLLYPPTPPDPQLPVQPPPPLPAAWLLAPQRLRLVVLDGTWRKSRKMLYLNPALQRLPRLQLQAPAPGRYSIRKAHAAHQLSSFEAAVHALAQLHGWGPTHPHVENWLHALDGAMAHHHQLQQQGQRMRAHASR